VDNNSTDGSAGVVAEYFKDVELIASTSNLGFGGGHNLAFRHNDQPFFLVLNPDVIVEAGSIEQLLTQMKDDDRVAIAGPCLVNSDGSLQYSARRFYDWPTVLSRRLPIPFRDKRVEHHLMKDVDFSGLERVDVNWVMGAVMLCRRDAFDGQYLFDPRYKLYFEDVDLCYFAKQRGYKVIYLPFVKMVHDHQRLSAKGIVNKAAVTHFKSWLTFRKKCRDYAGSRVEV
jgi:hypothetical protein